MYELWITLYECWTFQKIDGKFIQFHKYYTMTLMFSPALRLTVGL